MVMGGCFEKKANDFQDFGSSNGYYRVSTDNTYRPGLYMVHCIDRSYNSGCIFNAEIKGICPHRCFFDIIRK